MKYTDKELIKASQIAYFSINQQAINDIVNWTEDEKKNNPSFEPSYTLSELYEHSETFRKSVYKDISNMVGLEVDEVMDSNCKKDDILKRINDPVKKQMAEEKYKIIDEIKTGEIGSWKVVSYVDNNAIGVDGTAGKLVDGTWDHQNFSSSGDGLAAMVFETANGQAITAFRGSEGMDDPLKNRDDILADWIASDFGLSLYDRDTPQQNSVYKYMEDYVLDLGYDDITLTGHSLGGNLAMHAAVSSYEISADNARKMISNVVSFDGPGFSDGYMFRHYLAISAINGQRNTTLSHYTWSIVGVLLNHLNGTYDWKTYAECRADDLSKVYLGPGDRHDMAFAQYDNNGNLLPATQEDLTALKFGEMVDGLFIDYILKCPEEIRPSAVSLLIGMIDCAANYTDDGKLSFQDFFDIYNVLFKAYIKCDSGLEPICFKVFASGFFYNLRSKSIISFLVDNTYKLSEYFAKGKHEIKDNFGVNQIYFPEGVKPENIKVSLEGLSDVKVLICYDNGETDYFILRNYQNRVNDTSFLLFFTYPAEKNGVISEETLIMSADYKSSPFRTLYGTPGDDLIRPIFHDTYPATIFGGDGDDQLVGSKGDDIIYGGKGNDFFEWNPGDDYLDGGEGNDRYNYGVNCDNDTIFDCQGQNTVHFYELTQNDLSLRYYQNNDVVFTIKKTGETLTIKNFQDRSVYRNFVFEFADGTIIRAGDVDDDNNEEDIFTRIEGTDQDDVLVSFLENSTVYGKAGDDIIIDSDNRGVLYGGSGDDKIYGNGGHDTLYGNDGNDILDGGEGDDYLDGGSGDDTYIYGKGSGNDTILDGNGTNRIRFTDLMPDDLTVYYPPSNSNAVLTITETGETLTIRSFRSAVHWRNFILEFADGTTLSVDETGSPFLHIVGTNGDDENIISFFTNSIIEVLDGNDKVNAANVDDLIYGGAGNDSLYGNDGNDILDGGEGDDYLDGGSGDDTYIYGKGSGNDTILDGNGTNRIRFTDLMPDDLTVYYPPSNSNAVLTITETGETLTIRSFRSAAHWRNFILEFENGRTGKIDYGSTSIVLDPLTVTFCIGNGNVVVPNDVIGEIKFNGLSPADLTAFYSDNSAVLTITSTGEKLTIENFSGFVETQKTILSFNNGVNIRFDSEGSPFLNVAGTDSDDMITAFFANSVVNGLCGNDTLIGTPGKDVLYGGEGEDILNGGEGDDYLDGGHGNDTYIYGSGFSNDVINDADGINKIRLAGLNAADLSVSRVDENNIVLMIVATGETLTINNFRKEGVDSSFVFEFDDMSTGTIDWDKAVFVINDPENSEEANLDKIVIFEIGNGDQTISADSRIDKIKFIGLTSTDLTAYFAADGSAVLMAAETGEKLTIENFAEFADTNVVLEFENQEMRLDDQSSPFLNVVGTDSDDEITAFYKNSSMFGGVGSDTYSLAAGFGANVIEDNDGNNTIKFINTTFDAVSFEVTDGGDLIVANAESGDALTIRGFVSERFKFEFADGVSRLYDTEIGKFKNSGTEQEPPVDELPEQNEGENADKIGDNNDDNLTEENGEHSAENNSREGSADENSNGSGSNPSVSGEQTDSDNSGEGSDGNLFTSKEQIDSSNLGEDSSQNTTGENDDGAKNDSPLLGGAGNDTYSFELGFGTNTIEDNEGDNTVAFLGISSDAVSFEMTNSGELVITVTESGDVLTIRNFNSERFTFEFADEVSGTFNVETVEFERILSEEELAQANADILGELYADDNSVSDLLTENDNTVISEITDSASTSDENGNTADQIDVQVMILTENMAAFSNKSNISDSMNMQNSTDSLAFADQLLVGTQA